MRKHCKTAELWKINLMKYYAVTKRYHLLPGLLQVSPSTHLSNNYLLKYTFDYAISLLQLFLQLLNTYSIPSYESETCAF